MSDCSFYCGGGKSSLPILGCAIVIDGYSVKQKTVRTWNSTLSEIIIDAKTVPLKDFDRAVIEEWYRAELDYGRKSFTVLLDIFGVIKEWKVEMMNDLSNVDFTSMVASVPLQLKLAEPYAIDCSSKLCT